MLHISKIDDNILIDFAAINFSKSCKSIREEQTYRKVAKSLCIFLKTHDEVEKYVEIMQLNSSGNCSRL